MANKTRPEKRVAHHRRVCGSPAPALTIIAAAGRAYAADTIDWDLQKDQASLARPFDALWPPSPVEQWFPPEQAATIVFRDPLQLLLVLALLEHTSSQNLPVARQQPFGWTIKTFPSSSCEALYSSSARSR